MEQQRCRNKKSMKRSVPGTGAGTNVRLHDTLMTWRQEYPVARQIGHQAALATTGVEVLGGLSAITLGDSRPGADRSAEPEPGCHVDSGRGVRPQQRSHRRPDAVYDAALGYAKAMNRAVHSRLRVKLRAPDGCSASVVEFCKRGIGWNSHRGEAQSVTWRGRV